MGSRSTLFILFYLWGAFLWAEMPGEAGGFAGSGLHLYPLGWSPEGRWGVLIGRHDSEKQHLSMLILDAVTDEVLYRSGEMEWSGPESFAHFWKRYGASVEKKAQTWKLDTSSRPDVRDARFVTGGIEYAFIMSPPSPASGAYSLSIYSSRFGSKSVYNAPSSSALDQSFLLGALVSPFEKRALAVIREMPRYGKGESSFRFSGAHLTQGFPAEKTGGIKGTGRGQTVPAAIARGSVISAVLNGQEYLVQARLAAGGDPESKDDRGYTALLIASRLGYWTIVKHLLAAGASPLPQDGDGRSALHYAAFAGDSGSVKALLKAGASKFAKDNAGRTAVELAASSEVRSLFQ